MSLLFGKLTQDFVNFQITIGSLESSDPNVAAQAAQSLPAVAAGFKASAAMDASYLVYIGVGILVCVYAYMTIWVYTAEMSSKRLRERYLAAILRQDIAFFDDVGAGEVATRIQTDTRECNVSFMTTFNVNLNVLHRFIPTRCIREDLFGSIIYLCILHW